jgi:hypothetical protein
MDLTPGKAALAPYPAQVIAIPLDALNLKRMRECFARTLGDCDGAVEDEHFIPRVLQEMVGPVAVKGLAWQRGTRSTLQPGSYAHTRIICERHHDQLDGLDGNAASYFRNLMLIANPDHVASGVPGRREDISPLIDGPGFERWFLKTICGAIASKSIENVQVVPDTWIRVLFGAVEWPDEWAMYVTTGNREPIEKDAKLQFDFHWTADRKLNGMVVSSFAIETVFAMDVADRLNDLLKRPRLLGASVQRPQGGPALEGMPIGEHIRFQLSWPGRPAVHLDSLSVQEPANER